MSKKKKIQINASSISKKVGVTNTPLAINLMEKIWPKATKLQGKHLDKALHVLLMTADPKILFKKIEGLPAKEKLDLMAIEDVAREAKRKELLDTCKKAGLEVS
tara:strand:- start:256 stop:567 length:312 start_codon:yes stop_codon:yes gene_type:complete